MPAKTIMIQGTGSHVGKSVITAGFCRILKQDGFKVAPFKSQNMSNNSFVTQEGGEMGRAQVVQAEACGIEPSIHMNPILLKPSSDLGAQVVVHGKPFRTMEAREYQFSTTNLIPQARESLNILMNQYEAVVIEGAGSPAEINLQDYDIVNMRTAEWADAPVILVGDIDRGGVFASFVGTLELLPPYWRNRIQGFLINKFRGDAALLEDGIDYLMGRTGIPTIGVIPYDSELKIMEEDGLSDERIRQNKSQKENDILIDVVMLPRISNLTDFHHLDGEEHVTLTYLKKIPNRFPDVLIIPGTKSTIADLEFLNANGFSDWIQKCINYGTTIIGICGGFQMLGEHILDTDHVESTSSKTRGFGLFPMVTFFESEKVTKQVKAKHVESGIEIEAYEIHMGKSTIDPSILNDGIFYKHQNVFGTYLHGIFNDHSFRTYFLNQLRQKKKLMPISLSRSSQDPYDHLADLLRTHVDMDLFYQILNHKIITAEY